MQIDPEILSFLEDDMAKNELFTLFKHHVA
jgi:hypothetical protein